MEANLADRWLHWAAMTLPIAPGWHLRPLADDDIPALVASVDDHVRRGLMMARPFDHEEVARLVQQTAPRMATQGRGAMWAIARQEAEASTAKGVLTVNARQSNLAQVGFWLGADARGRGVAAAALRTLAQELTAPQEPGAGFGLSGLTWISSVGNVDSLRAARSAGFTPVGTSGVPLGGDDVLHNAWWAEWTPEPSAADRRSADRQSADRRWADCLVEIAAGAWQLQPMDAASALEAERLLPVSACVPTGVWAAKEITTARVDAVVALLSEGDRAWVIAQSASAADTATNAAVAAAEVVQRYARRALGLITP